MALIKLVYINAYPLGLLFDIPFTRTQVLKASSFPTLSATHPVLPSAQFKKKKE